MNGDWKLCAGICIALVSMSIAATAEGLLHVPAGWSGSAARDEIRPVFRFEASGGRHGGAAFVIAGDQREGTSGWWEKSFEVEGGKTYRFSAWRKTDGVDSPRLSG